MDWKMVAEHLRGLSNFHIDLKHQLELRSGHATGAQKNELLADLFAGLASAIERGIGTR